MAELKKHSIVTFPVSLLLSGRQVLVVGGGRVAERKIIRLLESGAVVSVCAPEPGKNTASLAGNKKIIFSNRVFDPAADLDTERRPFLVYAATDNPQVNLQVITECRARGIPVCAADENWQHGDFITPASFNGKDLSISVSTGGQSCISSKKVRDYLARQIPLAWPLDFIVISTDHRISDLNQRERFHLNNEKRAQAGEMIRHVAGVHEFVFLITCNRIELYAVITAGHEAIIKTLCRIIDFDHLDETAFTILRGREAFGHLARVLAGIYSQVTGEKHIVSQAEEAWGEARHNNWAGDTITKVYDGAKHVSRKIRKEVEPVLYEHEIEDIALEYAAARGFFRNPGTVTAVLGTGLIGQQIVERLGRMKPDIFWVYHRVKPEPSQWTMAALSIPWAELPIALRASGLIFTCLAGNEPVIGPEQAEFISRDRPVTIIDLGVPRNVAAGFADMVNRKNITDSAAGSLIPDAAQCTVIDLETLKHWYRDEKIDIASLYRIADKVISREDRWYPLAQQQKNPGPMDFSSRNPE
ncbi:MAG TPA: hypothetical protein DC049_00530 [Spirochaetia bacterium]|nr:hypothetical protein [Spirochaetia bacterium]